MSFSQTPERRVPWWVGLAVFAGLIAAIFLFSLVLSFVVTYTGRTDALSMLTSPTGLLIQVLFMSGTMAGLALLAPRLAGVKAAPWLGLKAASPKVMAVAALGVVGLGFLVDEATFVLHVINAEIFTTSGLDLFNHLFVKASPALYLLLTLTVMAGPGIGEELFFRGLVLRAFQTSLPAWAAVMLSSIMFGIIHFDALQSPGAGLIGIYLGFLVLRTGSLWPAIGAHALNNLICAIYARFSPPDTVPVWDTGHPWWLLLSAALLTIGSIAMLVRLTAKPPVIPEPEMSGPTADPKVVDSPF